MNLTREIRDGRIAICQDVIDRILNHDLKVMSESTYLVQRSDVSVQDALKIINNGYELNKGVQGIVDAIEPYCQVCARGAMMLSKARVFDDMPMTAISTPSGWISADRAATKDGLEDFFNVEDLAQIETAFEVNILDITNQNAPSVKGYDWDKLRGAWHFGKTAQGTRYGKLGSKKRCLAVMRNIVANDGVFTYKSVSISHDEDQMTCQRSNWQYPDFQG